MGCGRMETEPQLAYRPEVSCSGANCEEIFLLDGAGLWAIIVSKWSKRESGGVEPLTSKQEYLFDSFLPTLFGCQSGLGTSVANPKDVKQGNRRVKGIEFHVGMGH